MSSDEQWTPPDTIYLVRDEDGPWESEVHWCAERINDTDVEYSRVPAAGVPVEVQEAIATLQRLAIFYHRNDKEVAVIDAWLDSQQPQEQE